MTTLHATSLSDKMHLGPPLLCVPTELLHNIFNCLTPTEAANFRLLHKRIAEVGVDYIVPVIFLALSEDSFNKLEAIAQHPAISKHVNSIVFDATCLADFDRENWENQIYSLDMLLQREAMFDHEVGPRGSAGFEAQWAAHKTWYYLPRHPYTKDQLDRAFARYQRYRQEQHQLLRADVYLQRITQALANLPLLKNVVLDTHKRGSEDGLNTKKLWAAFGSGLCILKAHRKDNHSAGQSEVNAILNSAHRAGLRLETFVCSLLSWSYFSEYSPREYAGSLVHLKELDVIISRMKDFDGFITCLSAGWVLRFLTAAPCLHRLRFGVFTNSYTDERESLPNLEHFVGDFRWTLLVHVAIEFVQASENVLIGFLNRHSSTLRSVGFRSLSLIDGIWMSIFRLMRSMLRLEEAGFSGLFRDRNGIFSFDCSGTAAGISLKWHVRDYILGATEDTQPIEAYLNEYQRDR